MSGPLSTAEATWRVAMLDAGQLLKHVALPVSCDEFGIYIFDANGDMVMQVRGWGRLSKLGEQCGANVQKAIGDAFAQAFNEKFSKGEAA